MGLIGHADRVVKDGEDIGIASGIIYSYYFRKVLSLCTVDIDQAFVGNEVIIKWGDFGGVMKDVKARVAPYPYLTENRNQNASTT